MARPRKTVSLDVLAKLAKGQDPPSLARRAGVSERTLYRRKRELRAAQSAGKNQRPASGIAADELHLDAPEDDDAHLLIPDDPPAPSSAFFEDWAPVHAAAHGCTQIDAAFAFEVGALPVEGRDGATIADVGLLAASDPAELAALVVRGVAIADIMNERPEYPPPVECRRRALAAIEAAAALLRAES
jgi:hypothetical protein